MKAVAAPSLDASRKPHLYRRGRRSAVALAVLMTLFESGCGTPGSADPAKAEPGAGLAFGVFDFQASDIAATHVVLVRISPTKMYMGGAGERSTVTFTHGEFYAPNLSPGVYALNAFYSGDLRLALEGNLKGNTFKVEPGGIVYAGTYRVTYARKGLFQRDDGAFERVDSKVSETQLLRWLAKELAASDWAGRIRGRLAALES
jgi:hypothetical protein